MRLGASGPSRRMPFPEFLCSLMWKVPSPAAASIVRSSQRSPKLFDGRIRVQRAIMQMPRIGADAVGIPRRQFSCCSASRWSIAGPRRTSTCWREKRRGRPSLLVRVRRILVIWCPSIRPSLMAPFKIARNVLR